MEGQEAVGKSPALQASTGGFHFVMFSLQHSKPMCRPAHFPRARTEASFNCDTGGSYWG
jgi:hypothetical protein